MTYLTPKQAAELICPIARCQGTKLVRPTCAADQCVLWRWKPALASDKDFTDAVSREMERLKGDIDKPAVTFHKQAVANVMRDPAAHGITKTHGYCGLGGQPT